MRLFEGTQWDVPPTCTQCGALDLECTCPPATESVVPPDEQTARIRVEKRKRGKMVTVIRGLSNQGNHLEDLLTQLKSSLGAGGSLRQSDIEIQGDHAERLAGLLKKMGYRVANAPTPRR